MSANGTTTIRYHPRRLEVQLQALRADDGDFCFLTDQLHLFADTGTLYWDDWTGEIPPLDVVQGTLLGRTDKLPAYPALGRGEDTAVVRELVALGHRVTGCTSTDTCTHTCSTAATCGTTGTTRPLARASACGAHVCFVAFPC